MMDLHIHMKMEILLMYCPTVLMLNDNTILSEAIKDMPLRWVQRECVDGVLGGCNIMKKEIHSRNHEKKNKELKKGKGEDA